MTELRGKYDQYKAQREHFLRRARKCSEVTLPFLIPPEGHNASEVLPTPYQSVGARGVTNLAAKLLLALMPPGHSFFRLSMPDDIKSQLAGSEKKLTEVDKGLSDMESTVMRKVESSGMRPTLFEVLKLLIVSGNALLYIPETQVGARVFKLNDYVCKRDPRGNLLEIITRELVHPLALKEDIRNAVEADEDKDQWELFTHVKWDGSKWLTRQEVEGLPIPGSEGSYPKGKSPWFSLRWQKIDGEDYGRGLCEELLGDLISLEGLMKAAVVGAASASKVVFMVQPGSTTKASDLAKAESGDFVTGDSKDISTLQLEKSIDFNFSNTIVQALTERLASAFLLRETVQRDAERVTAEEIRYMATELDDALGGIFSILAQELQLPLVKRLMLTMQKTGELPALPEDIVEPVIVTGLDALGRSSDLQKLDQLVQQLFALDPALADKYIDIREYVQRRAVALGVKWDGLVRSDEEVQQIEQQAQQQAMLQQMIDKGAPLAQEAIRQGGQNG